MFPLNFSCGTVDCSSHLTGGVNEVNALNQKFATNNYSWRVTFKLVLVLGLV